MKYKIKAISWVLLLVLLGTMMASCAPAATPTEAPAAATEEPMATEAPAAATEEPMATEAPAATKLPVVGISTGSSGTSWRNIMIDALETVGKEYKDAGKIADYKLVNNVTNGDATEQANILRDFISQGVDIILVNPNSPDALNGVIKEAQDAGILVVSYDATVTAPDVLNVTLDHYAWNKKNVEFIAETLQKGNVTPCQQ